MDERERFYFEQKIKLNTEILKILAVVEIATITGLISLFMSGYPLELPANVLLLVFGGILIAVLLNIIIFVYKDTLELIEHARTHS